MHRFVEKVFLNSQAKDEMPNLIGHAWQAKLICMFFPK